MHKPEAAHNLVSRFLLLLLPLLLVPLVLRSGEAETDRSIVVIPFLGVALQDLNAHFKRLRRNSRGQLDVSLSIQSFQGAVFLAICVHVHACVCVCVCVCVCGAEHKAHEVMRLCGHTLLFTTCTPLSP